MDPDQADPDITIVIVTWNSKVVVTDCIESLLTTDRGHIREIIVVDNASSDGTVDEIRRLAPSVRVIANPTNRGLAAANNQGIAASCTPYVLLSNPDVVYRADTVAALRRAMDDHPRAAFVFSRLVHPGGTLQTTAGDIPTLTDAVRGRQSARDRQQGAHGFWWDGWAHDRPAEIGHGLEACYLARRDAIAEIGPQDEGFWLDWEGIDWCASAHERGWEVWFEPQAEATHVGGASLRQATARWILNTHRGMYRFFAKRRPAWHRPLLACVFGTRCVVKLVVAAVRGDRYQLSHPGSGPVSEADQP